LLASTDVVAGALTAEQVPVSESPSVAVAQTEAMVAPPAVAIGLETGKIPLSPHQQIMLSTLNLILILIMLSMAITVVALAIRIGKRE